MTINKKQANSIMIRNYTTYVFLYTLNNQKPYSAISYLLYNFILVHWLFNRIYNKILDCD